MGKISNLFMRAETIAGIPAIVIGERSETAYLFVHGKMGSKDEAAEFARFACQSGYQVVGIDLPEHGSRKEEKERLVPWTAVSEIKAVYAAMRERWQQIGLRANSIGAWLSMLALQDETLKKALFVSPVVNMEALIQTMMCWPASRSRSFSVGEKSRPTLVKLCPGTTFVGCANIHFKQNEGNSYG